MAVIKKELNPTKRDYLQCKETVYPQEKWGSFHGHRCIRNVWKDDYCKIHHPDSVKERREKAQKRYDEKRDDSDWMKLKRAVERIKELEAEIERLKRCLENRQ